MYPFFTSDRKLLLALGSCLLADCLPVSNQRTLVCALSSFPSLFLLSFESPCPKEGRIGVWVIGLGRDSPEGPASGRQPGRGELEVKSPAQETAVSGEGRVSCHPFCPSLMTVPRRSSLLQLTLYTSSGSERCCIHFPRKYDPVLTCCFKGVSLEVIIFSDLFPNLQHNESISYILFFMLLHLLYGFHTHSLKDPFILAFSKGEMQVYIYKGKCTSSFITYILKIWRFNQNSYLPE